MIELSSGEGSQSLSALLPERGHTWRRAFAVLAGLSRGRILTDDRDAPNWIAVQEFSDDSVLYLAGVLDRGLVHDLIARLRQGRVVTMAAGSDDAVTGLLPGADRERVDLDFEDRDVEVDLTRMLNVPAGMRLMRIDAELAERCLWPPWMSFDAAAAVRDGLGFCVLDRERVVAEAFAGPLIDGALEMATITEDSYQRRGLASAVCARTILECERLGHRTWWNTSMENAPSHNLARRLGYRTERHYRVLVWSPMVME